MLARLRAVVPPAQLSLDASERYPSINSTMEDELRGSLLGLGAFDPMEARRRVLALDARHGVRRHWPWASVAGGGASLARALVHLVSVALGTEHPLPGGTPEAMASAWVESGYSVDLAMLDACASVQREVDVAAVRVAVRATYGPWLDDAARRLQTLVAMHGFPGDREEAKQPLTVSHGELLFFADGLRYDVARKLAKVLEARGLVVRQGTRWVGMPSVTATSKHAASPIVGALYGPDHGKDFVPAVKATGKPLVADVFRKLLVEAGYSVVTDDGTGDPTGRGYLEYGDLDHEGHAAQDRLASRVDEHVLALADRMEALLAAGWRSLRVVTDHGWVLLPGGLPRCSLDASVSDDKWGRCAVLKAASANTGGLLTLPWRWNPLVTILGAPGVSVFYAGSSYAHGGLSLHECLTPDFQVTSGASSAAPKGVTVTWKNQRCTVKVASGSEALRLDVRRKANDPSSSVVSQLKGFTAEGTASVLTPHDLVGEAAHVVLLAPGGAVVYSVVCTIGG